MSSYLLLTQTGQKLNKENEEKRRLWHHAARHGGVTQRRKARCFELEAGGRGVIG